MVVMVEGSMAEFFPDGGGVEASAAECDGSRRRARRLRPPRHHPIGRSASRRQPSTCGPEGNALDIDWGAVDAAANLGGQEVQPSWHFTGQRVNFFGISHKRTM